MPRSPAELSGRVAEVLRAEGISSAAAKSLAWIVRLFYQRSEYLVFEHDLHPTPFIPAGGSIDVTAVCSPAEIGRIPAEPLAMIESSGNLLAPHLDNGGMIFFVIVDGKLAHESWVGTRLPSEIDPVSPHLVYDRLAYIGACETSPESRGKGLYPLVLTRICETLKSRGFSKAMLTVSPDNESSISGIRKAGFEPAGRGVLTRILGRSSWKHSPPARRKEV